MAVQAYILVHTEVGKAAEVARAIDAVDGVLRSDDVTGPYDVIVRAEAATVDALDQMVRAQVRGIPGITKAVTCPVVHM
jgi:DNA-binding Lrp family transcriptional regulator